MILGCPSSVVAGEDAIFTLSECDHENQSVEWSVSGSYTDIVGNELQAFVTTEPCDAGNLTVTAICEEFDIEGNITQTVLTCDVEIKTAKYLECEVSEAVCIEVVTCGTFCECAEFEITHQCPFDNCITMTCGIIGIDCPADIVENNLPCPELEAVQLIGQKAILGDQCNDEWITDCETFCCEPHKPVFLTGDVCSCGWEVAGAGVNGTTAANACGCSSGKLQFDGSITLAGSGPSAFVDCVVIWGHDIASGTVTFNGITQDVQLCFDGHSCEGFAQPVILSFPPMQIGAFTLTINSADGVTNCVEYIFVGRKMFTEELALVEGWNNPHNLLDYEAELKESDCGVLAVEYKHVPVDVTLTIACASEEWIKTEWRPYLRYIGCGNPILFQYSINRCENAIVYGFPSGSGFSSYTDPWRQTVGLNARVFTSQPKIKRFE